MATTIKDRRKIFTLSILDTETDEHIDDAITTYTYYDEDEAISTGKKFLKDNSPDFKYEVFINYGEYEDEGGDVYGDINLSLEVECE